MGDDRERDLEQLRMLAIANRVFGVLVFLCGFLFTPHFLIGIGVIKFPPTKGGDPFPFWIFGLFAGVAILLAWALGIASFITAKYFEQRKNIALLQVIAALQCLVQPLGTVLGVFSLIVLNRQSVRELFQRDRMSR